MDIGALKTIFFDVGYTLVNEDAVWAQRCLEQAQTPEAKALGLTAQDIYEEIAAATMTHKSPYRTVSQKYHFTQIAPYRHNLETLYLDAALVLSRLGEKYALGIIANQTDGLVERLEAFGIAQHLSYVISSWDYQIMKPDRRLFEVALKEANCAPWEAAMVGDRLGNDIAPAKSIGMHTIWIKQGFGGQEKPEDDCLMPDAQVHSLRELLRIL